MPGSSPGTTVWETPSHRLQDGGDALAAADALGGEGELLAFALQQRGGLAGDAGAGRTQGVAERNRAAVEINLARIDLQVSHAGQRLRGEGLVQFDHIDVVDGEPGALQRLL